MKDAEMSNGRVCKKILQEKRESEGSEEKLIQKKNKIRDDGDGGRRNIVASHFDILGNIHILAVS